MSLNKTSRDSHARSSPRGPAGDEGRSHLNLKGLWKYTWWRPHSSGAHSRARGAAFSTSAQVWPTFPLGSRAGPGCQTWLHIGHQGTLGPASKRPSSESDQMAMQLEQQFENHCSKPLDRSPGPRAQLYPVHFTREHARDIPMQPETAQISVGHPG